jgi:hypothetical protein
LTLIPIINVFHIPVSPVSPVATNHPLSGAQHPLDDTGLVAIAVYDYQAGDDDEISFEPDQIITNIEMVCLFTSN